MSYYTVKELNDLILNLNNLNSESDFVEFTRVNLRNNFSEIFDFESKELIAIETFKSNFLYNIDKNDVTRIIYSNIAQKIERDFGINITGFSDLKIVYFCVFFLKEIISKGENKANISDLLIFQDIFNLYTDLKKNKINQSKYKNLISDPKYLLIIQHKYSNGLIDVMKNVYLTYLWEKELLPKFDLTIKALKNV